MDVFGLRDHLIADYASYVQSFIQIRDGRIRNLVDEEFVRGLLWPDPLIQLNPSFEPGKTIDELVDEGILHPGCRRIFRRDKAPESEGRPLRLHKHQEDAIRRARGGGNYILSTGTGSGKSLAYFVPIVDHVLRSGSGKRIKAIVVYPMNALANSQAGELRKFLQFGFPDGRGPVTFRRYTGQESDEERKEIIATPPDILLTNFVMLELILTRPDETGLVDAAAGLRFLVLDELHTYRGRQGADVALLVRRVRDRAGARDLWCVGTSATLASEGTLEQQRRAIAEVGARFFGAAVPLENVVGETLRRATADRPTGEAATISELRARISGGSQALPSYANLTSDAVASWIETTFGLAMEPGSGRLVRSKPRPITGSSGAARDLSALTGLPASDCERAIRETLLAGFHANDPATGFPLFAFRLHQFLSRGDTVYGSLESEADRRLTLSAQVYVPGERPKLFLPLVFCRECGQEYYCVRKRPAKNDVGTRVEKRELSDMDADDDGEPGFLFRSSGNPWPASAEEASTRLPDDWLDDTGRVRRDRRKYLPTSIHVSPDGSINGAGALEFAFASAPFRFCLNCGVAYSTRSKSDFGKLSSLATEGRSTATTVLTLSAVRQLRSDADLPSHARKLLSFTDNRQDASLQAGHLNDFVEVGLLRGAIYMAVEKVGAAGLRHDELTQKVFEALDLPLSAYAAEPELKFLARTETERTLRDVLGYRLYRDLQRGWRIVSPNLEQCGLLEISYLSLEELCADEESWAGSHQALVTASPAARLAVCKTVLDFLRRELAIKVEFLEAEYQERLRQRSAQRLIPPWAIDENESLESACLAFPRARAARDDDAHLYVSPRGGFGLYLKRKRVLPDLGARLATQDVEKITEDLFRILSQAGILARVGAGRNGGGEGHQLLAAALIWRVGDGKRPFNDPIRVPQLPETGSRTNPYFVDFYRSKALDLRGIEAREHTAQVPAPDRERREQDFRAARLPILFCSPTMELGVDISELNVVNLRNVPPTPANYAQRSGRAGRSGQPALVFSYCTTFSPHDQYFFRRPSLMVAGAVAPPRLDLSNEELVRAHLQAVWLKETGASLGTTLKDILDLSGGEPSLALLPSTLDSLENERAAGRATARSAAILESIRDQLSGSDWFSATWLNDTFGGIVQRFDASCERWRSLYRAAHRQARQQNAVIMDASRSAEDKARAKQLRREAEAQIELLTEAANVVQSDFYSYRYFASEGFLPGYNFPRLPISAFIPGRRQKQGQDEFLSRPRFLAISEFGPRALVYHEGSRYMINRVILQVTEDEELQTASVKQCPACGYLHPYTGSAGPDLCQWCLSALGPPMRNLFRLRNVSTKRREKINSDEEERQRTGFELRSGFRFGERGGEPSFRRAEAGGADGPLAELHYGPAATLWRINVGLNRRKDRNQIGFVIDQERGYWAKSDSAAENGDEDPMSPKTKRVIPYVEDRRNCLVIRPTGLSNVNQIASLQAALKNAIQVCYQLEDAELAAERLPEPDKPSIILLYEAAEGGAGVLKRLVDDPTALPEVAARALEICHFDPKTGEDRRTPPGGGEECEAACYFCLLSYGNQRDHEILDRHAVRDTLLALTAAHVETSPVAVSREEHLDRLRNLCSSELERRWLSLLGQNGHRLPSHGQQFIASCKTRPDFLYESARVAIYVDGPHHEYPDRHARDQAQTSCLEDRGYTVIRFGAEPEWTGILAKFPHVFGQAP